VLDGGEWTVSRPGRFTAGTHWTGGGWEGAKPAWTQWKGEKIPIPAGNRTPVVQPVLVTKKRNFI